MLLWWMANALVPMSTTGLILWATVLHAMLLGVIRVWLVTHTPVPLAWMRRRLWSRANANVHRVYS